MKSGEFLELVGKMLAAQKEYFRYRRQSDLITAKDLEKRVGDVVKNGRLEPDDVPTVEIQPSLFVEAEDEKDKN